MNVRLIWCEWIFMLLIDMQGMCGKLDKRKVVQKDIWLQIGKLKIISYKFQVGYTGDYWKSCIQYVICNVTGNEDVQDTFLKELESIDEDENPKGGTKWWVIWLDR